MANGAQNTAMYANASASSGIPTWRYYVSIFFIFPLHIRPADDTFKFNATFPNLQTFPDAGVFHASEIKLIFGTYGQGNTAVSSRPSPPQQVELSEFMQGAWARSPRRPSRSSSSPPARTRTRSPSGRDERRRRVP